MFLRALAPLALASLVLTACNAPSDLRSGDPSAAVAGTVELDPSASTEAALLWVYYPGDGNLGRMPGERVHVEGAYPHAFSLTVSAPPPEDALRGSKTLVGHDPAYESRLGYGIIVALRPGTNLEDIQIEDIAGCDADHVVVYVESAIRPGSYGAAMMNAELGPGFHMMRAVWADMEEAWDCFEEECWSLGYFPAEGGFAEKVNITPGIAKLPLW